MILGYILTLVYSVLLAGFLVTAFMLRGVISKKVLHDTTISYIVLALLLIAFFVLFSLLRVSPVEQLYFDENIYQGIALNILHAGNALWCQYGAAMFTSCGTPQIYHDPAEISFYIAIAFAIFGISTQTAYGMSLLIGSVSIFLVLLLGSSLFGKREGLASAIVFALIPEIMIWSRTQALPNLIFMMFAILTFYAYEIYRNNRTATSMAFFLFALGIAVYVRIEAMLLVPLFIIIMAYESIAANGIKRTFKVLLNPESRLKLVTVILFAIMIIPEIYYIFYEVQNLNYGYGSAIICGVRATAALSLSNFKCNIGPNVNFFLGAFTARSYYPAYFSVMTTLIAIIGALALFRKGKNDVQLVLLLLWIFIFYIFYSAFYAGSVNFGVDARFMLVIYPAIAILAGFGIANLSRGIPNIFVRLRKRDWSTKKKLLQNAIFVLLLALFTMMPFYNALSVITITTQNMPQQAMPLNYVNFVYQNASMVPNNCLVFTFDPELWAMQNKSSAQQNFLAMNNSNFTKFASKYSCYVFDMGYWCTTPQFKMNTCVNYIKKYNGTLIVDVPAPDNTDNFSLYYLHGNFT